MIINSEIELMVYKKVLKTFKDANGNEVPYYRLCCDTGETIEELKCSKEVFDKVVEKQTNRFKFSIDTVCRIINNKASQTFCLMEVVGKDGK